MIADTEEEAIATWNRRTPSEQSAREAAAAVAMRERAADYVAECLAELGLPFGVESIRALPIDTTALDRLLAEAREEGKQRIEDLQSALDVALAKLFPQEPPDSRFVSDEFVAMAAVSAGITDEATRTVLQAAKARSTPA